MSAVLFLSLHGQYVDRDDTGRLPRRGTVFAPYTVTTPDTPDVPSADDHALVAAMAQGDERAAAALYDRHGAVAYGLALRMLGEGADAEEVVLDAFAKAWRDASRFDPSRGTVLGWLTTIVRSRALDMIRARGRRARMAETATTRADEPAGMGQGVPAPDRAVEDGDRVMAVSAALGALPDAQRRAIELAFFEGLTHQEVAERLREPLGTVKTRIRLGMLKLRDTLDGFAPEVTLVTPHALEALRELAPGYVMQTLSAEERARFDAALQDPTLAASLVPELEAHRAAIGFLAADFAVSPPPSLRDRLVERIALEHQEAMRIDETAEVVIPRPPSNTSVSGTNTPTMVRVPPFRASPPRTASKAGWYTAGVLGLAAAASLLFALNLRSRVQVLEDEVALQQRLLDRTNSRLASRDSTVDALTLGGRDLVQVRLVADTTSGAQMQVYWNRRLGQAVVHASGLAPIASDRAYCLWIIRNGKPEAVALFTPDAMGRQLLNGVNIPRDAANIAAFAVTEEPATGSPQPTMTPFLVGAVPAGAGPE